MPEDLRKIAQEFDQLQLQLKSEVAVLDPFASPYDLTSDPVRYGTEQLRLISESWATLFERTTSGDWAVVEEAASYLQIIAAESAFDLTSFIGGIETRRKHSLCSDARSAQSSCQASNEPVATETMDKALTEVLNYLTSSDMPEWYTRNAYVQTELYGVLPTFATSKELSWKQAVLEHLLAPDRFEALVSAYTMSGEDLTKMRSWFLFKISEALLGIGENPDEQAVKDMLKREDLKDLQVMYLRALATVVSSEESGRNPVISASIFFEQGRLYTVLSEVQESMANALEYSNLVDYVYIFELASLLE